MADNDAGERGNGFKAMSERAERGESGNKPTATRNEFEEMQQRLIDEIRARPMRAIGWAAAAGFVFAFMSSR